MIEFGTESPTPEPRKNPGPLIEQINGRVRLTERGRIKVRMLDPMIPGVHRRTICRDCGEAPRHCWCAEEQEVKQKELQALQRENFPKEGQ